MPQAVQAEDDVLKLILQENKTRIFSASVPITLRNNYFITMSSSSVDATVLQGSSFPGQVQSIWV